MKQVTYRINSREDYVRWIEEVKNSNDYSNANAVVLKVYTSQLTERETKDLYKSIKTFLPKAKVLGVSMTNFVGRKTEQNISGTPFWAKKLTE